MKKVSAGLLMCNKSAGHLQYFLVHPGGPFFANKDGGAWSIPKGLQENEEDLLAAAQREFLEETGIRPDGPFYELGSITQKGGKIVYAWAFTGAWDPSTGIVCNNFTVEWPPRSGRRVDFPEVDKAGWFDYDRAVGKVIQEQIPFLDRARLLTL